MASSSCDSVDVSSPSTAANVTFSTLDTVMKRTAFTCFSDFQKEEYIPSSSTQQMMGPSCLIFKKQIPFLNPKVAGRKKQLPRLVYTKIPFLGYEGITLH